MALVLGETKKPDPPPINAMYPARTQYGVEGPIEVSPSNPSEEMPRPIGASSREPTRSESRPLKGPINIKAAPKGVSRRPAVKGSLPYGPCRKNIRRNSTAPRAIPFSRPLRFASAKRRSRKRRSWTIGSLMRGSMTANRIKLIMPTTKMV